MQGNGGSDPGPSIVDAEWRTQDARIRGFFLVTQDPGQWTGLWTEDKGLMTEQEQNMEDG